MGNPSFRGVPVVFCVWNWKLLYKHWDICLVGRIVPMEISFLFPFFLLHSWFRCMSFISYLKIFTILMVVDASPNPPGFGWDFASLLLWMWPDPLSKSQCCGILEPGQGTATKGFFQKSHIKLWKSQCGGVASWAEARTRPGLCSRAVNNTNPHSVSMSAALFGFG